MSAVKAIGWIVLIFVGIVVFCLGALWLEKKFPSEQFDERQQMSRGKACGLGMTVGVVYFLVALSVMVYQVDGEKTIEPFLLVYIGLMLQIMVMSTYGLLTQSYLSFQQKPILSAVGFGFCGGVQLLTFVTNRDRFGPLSLVGHGTSGWVSLITGCCFLYLAAVLLIQHCSGKRNEPWERITQ